jgi:hypothetical protein
MAERDPVSTWFDGAARQFLERAYKAQGEWAGQYLAPPSRRALATLAVMGVNPYEVDRWGEVRWVRAYKRSVYYQLGLYGTARGMNYGRERVGDWPARSLEWQTGQRVLRSGWPSRRWALRVRLHPTGRAASEAARKIPQARRWVVNGRPTELQSLPGERGF